MAGRVKLMKIVEINSNEVRCAVAYWNSINDIPSDVPDIYREAPDEVQEGWLYDPETNVFSQPPEPEPPPKTISPITNAEVMQATMRAAAMMDVLLDKNVLSKPPRTKGKSDNHITRYDFWRRSYFRNHANAETLQRLADGGVLKQYEVDGIIADRFTEFGI